MMGGWAFHAIDSSGTGADGVDVRDLDGDGDLDVTSGWEKSGWVKVYLNPGRAGVGDSWPSVDVEGDIRLTDTEDATFADLDGNGEVDAIVTACDNPCRKIGIHWLVDPRHMNSPGAWQGTWLDSTTDGMFLKATVGQIDGDGGRDIVAGSKTKSESVGRLLWYQAPAHPSFENAERWQTYEIGEIDWPNNLKIVDMDENGDADVLVSDAGRLSWFENPGLPAIHGAPQWTRHEVGIGGNFVLCDINQDGTDEIVAVGSGDTVARWFERLDTTGDSWQSYDVMVGDDHIPVTSNDGSLKGVDCGDLDGNNTIDLVFSVSGRGHGVIWLSHRGTSPAYNGIWDWHGVIEVAEMKFDNIRMVDVDQDGDLDLVSTDEKGGWAERGWGVMWLENLDAGRGGAPLELVGP
jgi:hypothetical protein